MSGYLEHRILVDTRWSLSDLLTTFHSPSMLIHFSEQRHIISNNLKQFFSYIFPTILRCFSGVQDSFHIIIVASPWFSEPFYLRTLLLWFFLYGILSVSKSSLYALLDYLSPVHMSIFYSYSSGWYFCFLSDLIFLPLSFYWKLLISFLHFSISWWTLFGLIPYFLACMAYKVIPVFFKPWSVLWFAPLQSICRWKRFRLEPRLFLPCCLDYQLVDVVILVSHSPILY